MQRISLRAAWILLLCLPLPLSAQTTGSQKPAAVESSKPRLGQANSQRELDAYNKMHNEVNPAQKRILIDQFVTDYPDSGLLAYVFQDGVYLGWQSNNAEMMADYGEKSLELWPDNYTLLTELGSVYVQRNRVDEAEAKATAALQLIVLADKPAHMTDPQWAEEKNMLMASNHTTLGFVHLRRAQASQEAAEKKSEAESALPWFSRALGYRPVDEFAFYGLGFSYALLNDYPRAEANIAKAVVIQGMLSASARTFLESIYKSQHSQSLTGLEQVFAKARTDLGIY